MADGPALDHNLNRLHQGTARCIIGSMPVSYTQDDAPPSVAINASITAFRAPGLELKYVTDASYKGIVHIPVTEDNAYFGKALTITMISDDRSENYFAFHRYMETLQRKTFPIEDTDHRIYSFDRTYRNRLAYIPRIDIVVADDSMQKHQTIRFERCYPLLEDELKFDFQKPSPVVFTQSFVYSWREIIREIPPTENTTPIGVVD
jgi:hypothetical protein